MLALLILASVASAGMCPNFVFLDHTFIPLTFYFYIASSNWLLNTIAPTQNGVSLKENLEWRLMSSQKIKEGDCIRFSFQNPYLGDAPETYKSFDLNDPYKETCQVSQTT